MALLDVKRVTKRFGGIIANRDIDLSVGEWEIVGLIGPNGAGKTTLFNCIAGVYPVNAGVITFRDEPITHLKTHERAALGIGRSFQNLGLVKGQTTIQNLITAQHMIAQYGVLEGMAGAPRTFAEERELMIRGDRILDFINLTEYRDEIIDDLPYGVQKNIELGAVLATDPQLLMLDEPSSGLSPTESDELGDILLRLREELGVTILMIEHHVPLVVRVCDYVYVLNFGELLTEGLPQEVQKHPDVIAAYLGGGTEESEEASEGAELAEPSDESPTFDETQEETRDEESLPALRPAASSRKSSTGTASSTTRGRKSRTVAGKTSSTTSVRGQKRKTPAKRSARAQKRKAS